MAGGEAWRDPDLVAWFASGREAIVPESRTQIEILLHIVRARSRPTRTILDVGCGDGVLLALLLEAVPNARGLGLDYSAAMLERAAERLRPAGARAQLSAVDLRTPAWREHVDVPIDLVVSGFAIHHLPDERKRALYGEIFACLAPGGTFLNVEHVASASPAIETLHDEAMIAFQIAARQRAGEAVDAEAIRATYVGRGDKNDNILAPVEAQCGWLRAIGFADVDVFWKWFELALFGGTKPCS
jgi:tRNA (cmo5U34)-methyltransferase